MLRKPMRFRVKPDPRKRFYYNVLIFDTKVAMHAFWGAQLGALKQANLTDQKRADGKFEAQCSWWDARKKVNGRWRKSDHIGQVIFHNEMFGAGIVAHEMCHAALYYITDGRRADAKGAYKLTKRDDERLALVCGELVRQFWNKWYAKGGK